MKIIAINNYKIYYSFKRVKYLLNREVKMKKYKKRNLNYFILTLISIFTSTIFAVVLQFFKGDVLDNAIAGETKTTVKYAILLIIFIFCEILFYFAYRLFKAKFVVGCTKLLKQDIFKGIINRSYVDFKERSQGEYIAKYVNEADAIKSRHFEMLPLFWEILFKIIFVSVALFVLDWRLALITILLLTTPLYIPKLLEKKLQKAQNDYLKSVEENLAKINDWLSGFEIIKNFSIERQIIDRFDESNLGSMNKLLKDLNLGAVSQLITTLISYLSYFVVLIFATWLVFVGEFSAGKFFVAIGMIDQLSYPLISLAEIIRQLVAIKPSCENMDKFIMEAEGARQGKSLLKLDREIKYSNVSFAYPDGPVILNNFNFLAKKGKRYLIKGPSGCGKTTIVNMILKYYYPTKGDIEFDGISINDYSNTYDCTTVVRQEAILFKDSLRNNLTMYRDIPDKDLIKVLENLGLKKFATEKALDEIITENGFNLSGGEKKRICLARALLRDTDILIFDEPLANLDDTTAKKIEDILLSIEDKLVIIVSHQFSDEKLQFFDNIIDLQK